MPLASGSSALPNVLFVNICSLFSYKHRKYIFYYTQASMNVEQCVHKIPVTFYLNFKVTIFTSCYVWLTSGFGRTIFDIGSCN